MAAVADGESSLKGKKKKEKKRTPKRRKAVNRLVHLPLLVTLKHNKGLYTIMAES